MAEPPDVFFTLQMPQALREHKTLHRPHHHLTSQPTDEAAALPMTHIRQIAADPPYNMAPIPQPTHRHLPLPNLHYR